MTDYQAEMLEMVDSLTDRIQDETLKEQLPRQKPLARRSKLTRERILVAMEQYDAFLLDAARRMKVEK